MPSGKCKLKPHLLEWLKSGTLAPPNVGQNWSNKNSHSLLVEMKNGTATLEDNLADPVTAFLILPKEAENLCPYKNLHIDVYSSFIIIAKTWKQPFIQ